MKFTKMHGLGNDYIYVNCFSEKISNPSELSIKLSDRHFGIGSDGLVLIEKSDKCDFKMSMYNADGSQAEMCGNATRCIGKYVYEKKLTNKTNISLETLAGVKYLKLNVVDNIVESVTVDMGEPILESSLIPVVSDKKEFINQPVTVDDKTFNITCVSMGNPHAISYVQNVSEFPVELWGRKLEIHPLFPKKTNVEFIEVINKDTLKMRVWERGTGETLACGTGACASLVSSVLNGYCNRCATLKLLGGDLIIEWDKNNNHIYMTGPATFVFDGEINI